MRTLDEIRNWQRYSDAERDHIMDDVISKRTLIQEKAAQAPDSMYNQNQAPES